jgi:hypothetical protein
VALALVVCAHEQAVWLMVLAQQADVSCHCIQNANISSRERVLGCIQPLLGATPCNKGQQQRPATTASEKTYIRCMIHLQQLDSPVGNSMHVEMILRAF